MNSSCMRQFLIPAAILAFGVTAAMPGLAQDGNSSGGAAASSRAAGRASAQQPSRDVRASQLIGRDIKNARGETLGEFKDFLIDVGARRVEYAVLSFGGVLGFADKLYAYPMTAFSQSGGNELVLSLDQEKIKRAPGFARDAWPKGGDNRYFDEVERYFRGGDATRANPRQGLTRATELIGKNVNDRSGRDAGEIQDLVIDIGRARLSYVVLDFDKAWSLDNKLLPLPLSALNFPSDRGADLVLTLDRRKLDMSHGFERNLWPNLNAPDFRNRMDAYFLALERPDPGSSGDIGIGGNGTSSSGSKAGSSGAPR